MGLRIIETLVSCHDPLDAAFIGTCLPIHPCIRLRAGSARGAEGREGARDRVMKGPFVDPQASR